MNGPHGFYPALLKQTMDSINNNITTTTTPPTSTTSNTNAKACTVSNITSSNNPTYISNINNNISSTNGLFTPVYPCGLQYGNPSLHTSHMAYPLPQQMQQQQQPLTQPQHCYPISSKFYVCLFFER